MNKEVLEKKIAELLKIGDEEKGLAFSMLKEKLAGYLKIDEAVKIPQLGVFQLKEKLGQTETSSSVDSDSKDLTLVFSPETSEGVEDSLFINLELESQVRDDSQFDEGVFQLGIDKPLATSNEVESASSSLTDLENSIKNLLENSEKLQNFDLWDDYLKAKESTSILEEDSEVDTKIDVDDDTNNLIVEPTDDTEFVPLDEKEEFDDLIDENNFIQDDELTSLTDEIEINDNTLETPIDESVDDIIEESANEEIELQEIEEKLKIVDEKISDETPESSVLDEIDLELKEEGPVEDEFDEIIKEQIESIKGGEVEEDESQIAKEIKNMHSSLTPPEEKEVMYRVSSKKRSPVIYALIAMFIIVGAIGIYYLFFRNPTWLYDEYEHEVALSEKHLQEYRAKKNGLLEEDSIAMAANNQSKLNSTKDDKENTETEKAIGKSEKNPDKVALINDQKSKEKLIDLSDKTPKTETEPTIANNKAKPPETKNSSSNTKTYTEKEMAQNIYYDGYVYNVQLSSWQKREVAEREVAKYMKKGFPAFLVKAYIPKYKSNWYRVRVGPYNSLDEAKIALKKIK